jgi:hypothetical protein
MEWNHHAHKNNEYCTNLPDMDFVIRKHVAHKTRNSLADSPETKDMYTL